MAQGIKRGRGWFGDSQGHSKAGRKGGLARSARSGNKNSNKMNTDSNSL